MLCKYSIRWRPTDLPFSLVFGSRWLLFIQCDYSITCSEATAHAVSLLPYCDMISGFHLWIFWPLSAPAASMYRRRGVFVHEGKIKMKIKREISHATGSELPRAFVICSHMLMSFDYDRWPNVLNWEGGMTLFSILGSRRRKWCMSAFSVTYCLRCLHFRLAKSGALIVKYLFIFRFMKCVFLSLDPSVWFFFKVNWGIRVIYDGYVKYLSQV